MELEIELKNNKGVTTNKQIDISLLALLKHMAIVGQNHMPKLSKLLRVMGMFLRFIYFFDGDSISENHFSKPPNILYDPTESAHFSNILGRAIADYLARRLFKAKRTLNYEAMMKIMGIPVTGKRPDLLAIINEQKHFAIEAKGSSYSSVSANRMSDIKMQAQSGPFSVKFCIASIVYNIFKKVKVKYFDPIGKEGALDKVSQEKGITEYYKGILQYLESDLFDGEQYRHKDREYFKLVFKREIIQIVDWEQITMIPQVQKLWRLSILLDYAIKRYVREGVPYSYSPIVEEENLYIDSDGVGLMIDVRNERVQEWG